jgi:AraC family transcriptional regulator
MNDNKLLVKNMVCPRCISAIENALVKLDIPFNKVALGEVDLSTPVSPAMIKAFDTEIRKEGFELIETRVNKIVADIKKYVLEYLAGLSGEKRFRLSSFITKHIHYDYSYLSDLFSSIEGITIEQFFIMQRIEKVKELLVYEQHSLTEIAFETGFSSVAHLSAQFKKITGLTASHFKKVGEKKRSSIDSV